MDDAIRRRLTLNGELTTLLAKIGAEPAIFYQRAADDTDLPEQMYPQIIFSIDKYSDTQKGLAGVLTVDVITTQMTSPPEPLERLIRSTLEGVFFRPTIGEIFSLKWQRTDIFTEPASERMPLIIGATLTFDIYEYPSVETSAPDPIEALNYWASTFDKNLMVIGVTEFEEFFEPSREKPAIYFDIQKINNIVQKSEAVFVDVTINMHVFAPTVKARREWLTAIHNALLLRGYVWLSDDSPMRLIDSDYNWATSEVEGQIKMTYNYGLLRKSEYAHTLMERDISFAKELRWQNDR